MMLRQSRDRAKVLVGAGEEAGWNCNTGRLGDLQFDDELCYIMV
jgi:hypothetical protein